MSFNVNFFARDYSIDEPRQRSAEEAAALARIVAEHGAADDADVFIDTEEASAGLSIRNLQPQHSSFIYEVCAATNWIAVFASGPDEHVALAASSFGPSEGTVFVDVFGVEAAHIVRSADDVSESIKGAFRSWSDGAGFDEIGQREENS